MDIVNSDVDGNQVSRFDTAGNSLDAHDGTLVLFDQTYYLYGTSYGCGYQYQGNASFCGFKVYSSTDLVHFADRGFAVPAGNCQYCFRPHVIYNASSKTYVMWTDAGGVYHVFKSASPVGPFSASPDPTLAIGGAVDESLFVDADGTGYLIHNTTQVDAGLTADMVVEKLTADYLNTTGDKTRLGLGDVEAFAVFRRGDTYHALMSDPSCAYCSGATGEMTATSMLGPWSGAWYDPNGVHQSGRAEPRQRARLVNDTNCGGQPLTVLPVQIDGGGTDYYFVSDRWNNRAPNESLANFYIGPLVFDAGGTLQAFDCVASFRAQLAIGAAGSYDVSPHQDQSSGFDGFRHHCDIQNNVQREQTFKPSKSGTLTRATVTSFRSSEPDAPLEVQILSAPSMGPEQVLYTAKLEPPAIPWAPRVLELEPNLEVQAGETYTLRLLSAATKGCYGFEYNDRDPYAGGFESLSIDSGKTFMPEPKRDLKFSTDLLAPEAGGEGGAPSDAGASTGGGGTSGGGSSGGSAFGAAGSTLGGATTGGSGGSSAGSGTAPSSTSMTPSSDSGCGCGVASRSGDVSAFSASLALLALLGRRRRLVSVTATRA